MTGYDGTQVVLTYFVFWMIVGGSGGLLIAAAMHKPRLSGFVVGSLLGVFGWLLIVLSKGNVKKCSHCGEQVQKSAVVCRYCQHPFAAEVTPERPPPGAGRLLKEAWINERPTFGERDFGAVLANEVVTVLDQTNDYTRIRSGDGREGWVRSDSIEVESADATSVPSALPVHSPSGVPVPPTGEGKVPVQAVAEAPLQSARPERNDGRISGELERLAALRTSGVLTEEEFTLAKRRVLEGS